MHPRTRKNILLVLTLPALFALIAPSHTLEAASWSTFRGPHGAGSALEGLPPGDGPLALELAWKRPLGSGYSGISIADGTVVTAFAAGERDVVVALDPTTGEERWRYDLAPSYAGHDGSHDGPVSTPAIADGRVFMLGPLGQLAALDLATGEPIWTAHLVEDFGSEAQYYGFASSPAVAGDTMVLQIGGEAATDAAAEAGTAAGSVAGFDAATGKLKWRAVADETMAQSPVVAEIGGRPQVLVLGSKLLVGLDPADGSVLWQIEHGGEPGPFGSWTSSPLPLGGDRILLKHEDPKSSVIGITAGANGPSPAVLRTSSGLSRSYSPPAVSGGQVYGFTARFLSAVDPETGDLLWRSREPGDGFVATVGGQLAVLTKEGSLHLGAASTEGWQESTSIELFEDLAWTPPSYANGAFYVRSLGEIARVNLTRRAPELVAEVEIPAILAEITAAENPAASADRLLGGRTLPLVDGDNVLFVWRGDASDVAIAGDMIGMRREEKMHPLEGTDLFWWATELDRHARISYLFFVDYEPATDPSHDNTVTSTVLGRDMNWFRGGDPMQMSWFAMPDWPGHVSAASDTSDTAGASAGSAGSPDSPATETPTVQQSGRLETIQIAVERPAPEPTPENEDSEAGEAPEPVMVPVHVWLPPGYDQGSDRYPVVYVHNAFAREPGGWLETLDRVVGTSVQPLIAVFPEVPRMPGLRDAFTGTILPTIDEKYRTKSEREFRANIGQGWQGVGATALTFSNPDQFGVLGVQSFYALNEQMASAKRALGEATAETLPLKIYLEWGRWDLISPHEQMNMRASSQEAWQLFRERGWEPVGGEVWDSTDWASWANRTAVMLEELFPAEGTQSRLADWLTGGS